jgi:hypothetical protein
LEKHRKKFGTDASLDPRLEKDREKNDIDTSLPSILIKETNITADSSITTGKNEKIESKLVIATQDEEANDEIMNTTIKSIKEEPLVDVESLDLEEMDQYKDKSANSTNEFSEREKDTETTAPISNSNDIGCNLIGDDIGWNLIGDNNGINVDSLAPINLLYQNF